jgi:nucleoside-diphosphate-sugar epimerase
MKILVLGSEGQVGKPFCEYAEYKGHQVIRFDKKLAKKFHDLSHGDNTLDVCISNYNPDVVLFLAFEVGGSKYLKQKDKTFEYISENVRLMDNTFRNLKNSGKPYLFASSQMKTMHHTNYGFLKDLGERYVQSMDNGHICKFWNVYGYEDPSDPKSHVITDFIKMAKEGEIRMMTTGREERQFLHTDDCSKALLHWCENYESYDRSKSIDITSFEWTSILSIAQKIQKFIPCTIQTGSKEDSIQTGIKNTPSEYVLNFWKPELSLEDGIKKLI